MVINNAPCFYETYPFSMSCLQINLLYRTCDWLQQKICFQSWELKGWPRLKKLLIYGLLRYLQICWNVLLGLYLGHSLPLDIPCLWFLLVLHIVLKLSLFTFDFQFKTFKIFFNAEVKNKVIQHELTSLITIRTWQ